ncbi:nitrilase-related carbon-nitrogen hydrolase [Engelhardtia mirabilis]|uniref:Glutamine-dependent NAD(+) synthetase n=1 Tax=Engelhardtia mirabilis TaxID=2528011 RepID=A0A518BDF6_9BACT|nr:Glutamine-dependent NAD(+) synthetase [Planctomycetes bacterium Pla133]QDU99330.1 Glutamine-dependent NAD(+) synthetase [Planctomycetes bacterium Pla86]
MNRARIRIAQVNPRLGDLAHNLDLHLAEIEAARADGIQVLVFPELSLTGYFLKDQTAELAMNLEAAELQRLIGESGDLSICVGFVERSSSGAIYNAAAWLERGEVKHVHRKVHLVSYGMFDEGRDFAAGTGYRSFDSIHGRFGILICEDLWHMTGAYTYLLDEVDGLIVTSASPARGVAAEGGARGLRSARTWDRLAGAFATLTQSWLVFANRVGFEDGVAFGGGSAVYGPGGDTIAQLDEAALLDPGRLDATLDGATLRRARVATPLRRDERPWVLASELAARDTDGRRIR